VGDGDGGDGRIGGTLSRRELARLLGLGALVARGASTAVAARAGEADFAGRVGVAHVPANVLDPLPLAQARTLVGQALRAATGTASAREAASALFRADDTVGIKLNCIGGARMSPRPVLVEALAGLLAEVGIPPSRIIAFERSSRELKGAGYPIRREGGEYLCYGIDNDYEREPSTSGQIGSCFARLVSSRCTALVSFGVVKDHGLAGVSAGIKNLYGLIHNPNKYHDHNCDPYAADVLNHPWVRGKLRLTVLDGIVAQCNGGPAYRPDATWPLGVVAVSRDPVAIDAWAWKAIDAERRRRGLPSLAEAKRAPAFLATAERYGLGVGDPARVREVVA
jgi:uncharacterized protein (DUF362 family)